MAFLCLLLQIHEYMLLCLSFFHIFYLQEFLMHGVISGIFSYWSNLVFYVKQIIEEGPITVAPLQTVKKLEQAARRLAKCVNYVGAATVEYLYSMESGEYYFLELNPRLQVCDICSNLNSGVLAVILMNSLYSPFEFV